MMKIISRLKSIFIFEILRYRSKKYISKKSILIDKDTLFFVYIPATDYYYLPYFQLYQFENVFVSFSYINSNELFLKTLRKTKNSSIYSKYIDVDYDNTKKYVFFFDGKYSWCSNTFREYLKKRYPGCKIIFHLGDLLSTHKNIHINEIKRFSDLVVTYDHNDADSNDLIYHSDPYSKLPREMLINDKDKCQLLFYGYAQNREEEILSVYDIMKNNGVKCDFCVPDLSQEGCGVCPELANAKFTPYLKYLKKVQNSDCILEIIQRGSRGCTFRTWEAIVYNKRLITNNQSVLNEEFYNPQFIQVIDSLDSINVDWIKNDVVVDYGYSDRLSPEECFKFYLDRLNKNIE